MCEQVCPETWHQGSFRLHTNPLAKVKTHSVAKDVLQRDRPPHWDAFLASTGFRSNFPGQLCTCRAPVPSLGVYVLVRGALRLR